MGSGLDKEQAMECRGGGPAKEGNGLRDSCTEGRGRGTGSHEGILKPRPRAQTSFEFLLRYLNR